MLHRFYQVADDFYPNPERIRRKALQLTYAHPEELIGWRTKAYHPEGIKQLIEKRFRVRITYWEKDRTATDATNGVFMTAFSRGKRAETVGVHYDTPVNWMMFIVYLTPNAPRDCGTSFWMHRKTGLVCRPTIKDVKRLGLSFTQLETMFEEDSQVRSRWKELDRVANIFNRGVMFPSGLFHSATRHFGNNHANGRLYQTFHFPIRSR